MTYINQGFPQKSDNSIPWLYMTIYAVFHNARKANTEISVNFHDFIFSAHFPWQDFSILFHDCGNPDYSGTIYGSTCNGNPVHYYSGTIYGSTCDLYMANCWSLTCLFTAFCLWPSSSRWWKCWMRACVAARRCWSWESCCLAPSARFSLIESHRVLARCSFATCKRVTDI